MNTTDFLMSIATMAGQTAQMMPQVGNNSSSGKGTFQSMLNEKRPAAEKPKTDGKDAPKKDGAAPAETTADKETGAAENPQAPEGQEVERAAFLAQMGFPAQMLFQPQVTVLPAEAADNAETVAAAGMVETPETAGDPAAAGEETVQMAGPMEENGEMPAQPKEEIPQEQAPTVETGTREVQETAQKPVSDVDAAPKAENRDPAKEMVDEVAVEDGGSANQPLFRETESVPVKVGESATLDTQSDRFDSRLAGTLNQALNQGRQQVEIRLTPENLGSVTVQLTRGETGLLHVVLRADTDQAAHLLKEHASVLSQLLQNDGQERVHVEVQQPQERNGFWQQDQNEGRQQNQGHRQQERRPQQGEAENFLNQLRLGLYQTESL